MQSPLVDEKILLQKMPGKGGWTYALLPGVKPAPNTHFGWRKVKGSIDGVVLKQYHLMPFGNGTLFLPVKAEVRKKIKKEAGDYVHVLLYDDTDVYPVPEELLLCLQDEPEALQYFNTLSEEESAAYSRWIDGAKSGEIKVRRIAAAVNRLAMRLPFSEKKIHQTI